MALAVAREAVIRNLIPGCPRSDEGVELRADPGLAVKRPEADRDLFALRPLCTEQARAADRAEGLHASAVRPEDADQLLTGEQSESHARNASLRSAKGARVLSAPRAVAVIGPAEGRRHLEVDAAAEARAVERVLGAWFVHAQSIEAPFLRAMLSPESCCCNPQNLISRSSPRAPGSEPDAGHVGAGRAILVRACRRSGEGQAEAPGLWVWPDQGAAAYADFGVCSDIALVGVGASAVAKQRSASTSSRYALALLRRSESAASDHGERIRRRRRIATTRRGTPMGKWFVGSTAAVFAALAAFAAGAAMASNHAGGVTIKTTDKGQTYVINKSVTDWMYFSPANMSVKSGDMLTFTYDGKPVSEPHTISVVAQKDLPTTNAQINACENGGDKVCNTIIAGLIKNPKAPPGPTNDIVHWTADKGQPGLDGPGDSVAIEGAKHKSISIKVTAPAGTTLHFFCVVHPWMQGKITVR
jgi:plastocyanin